MELICRHQVLRHRTANIKLLHCFSNQPTEKLGWNEKPVWTIMNIKPFGREKDEDDNVQNRGVTLNVYLPVILIVI